MENKFRHLENQAEIEANSRRESLLEKAFESGGVHKANEGHHGVILELGFDGFSLEEKQEFCRLFNIPFTEDGEIAIKMLKLYRASEAEKEFSAQEKAARAVNDDKRINDRVGVPECYFGGEIALASGTLKQEISASGIDASAEKFGMIMMDYVKGEDLGVYCYKQFIKVNLEKFKEISGINKDITPDECDLYLAGKSIDDLILLCHQILGVKAKYHYLDDSIEAQQERNQLSKMIISVIEKRGLIKMEKVDAMREAIGVMHEAGVFHRDLHLRNIVAAEDGKMFIVDFGSARIIDNFHTNNDEDIYRSDEEDHVMQRDESVLILLDKLATTPEEAEENKAEQNLHRALKIKKIVQESPEKKNKNTFEKKAVAAWKKLEKKTADTQDLSLPLKQFSYDLGEFAENDAYFDNQIVGLMLLFESGRSELVRNHISTIINQENVSPIYISKLNSLEKTL